MRMLLLKQDQLCQLEAELDDIDRSEDKALFLGNSRRDRNSKRQDVIKRLDEAFAAYGNPFLSLFVG